MLMKQTFLCHQQEGGVVPRGEGRAGSANATGPGALKARELIGFHSIVNLRDVGHLDGTRAAGAPACDRLPLESLDELPVRGRLLLIRHVFHRPVLRPSGERGLHCSRILEDGQPGGQENRDLTGLGRELAHETGSYAGRRGLDRRVAR